MASQSDQTITDREDEDIAVSMMLDEGEKLIATPEKFIEWYLSKRGVLEHQLALTQQQFKRIKTAIEGRLAGIEYKFGPQVKAWTMEQVEAAGGKTKTVHTMAGTLRLRKTKDRIVVNDEAAFREWFQDQPADIRSELQPCFELKLVRKTPIAEYFENTGEVPPGCDIEPGTDSLSVQTTALTKGGG